MYQPGAGAGAGGSGSGGGNVHPSVMHHSPAAATLLAAESHQQQSFAGASALSPLRPGGANTTSGSSTGAASLDIDEAEARTRAREILQDFVQQKTKMGDLSTQLQRTTQENDRLTHLLQERQAEHLIEKERWMRQLETLKSDKTDAETRQHSARQELQKVTQSFAQRAADSTSHLHLKELEAQQNEQELLIAREELRKLRTEALQTQNIESKAGAELDRAQRRTVELARKLVDAERAKAALEQSILEDRKHHQNALHVIEGLRKQCVDLQERLQKVESQREKERGKSEAALLSLTRELDMQREMYKSFMTPLIANAAAAGGGWAGGTQYEDKTASSGSASAAEAATELQTLRVQFAGSKETIALQNKQIKQLTADLSKAQGLALEEKSKRMDATQQLQGELHRSQLDATHLRSVVAQKDKQNTEDKESLVKLISVHEASKKELELVTKDAALADSKVSLLKQQHREILTTMQALRGELELRDAAEQQLKMALEARKGEETRIRDVQSQHSHELELVKMQTLMATFGGGAGKQEGSGGNLFREMQQKLDLVDMERRSWLQERNLLQENAALEERRHQSSVEEAKRDAEQSKSECVSLRSQALHAQRETEEWRSAFYMSERQRGKLQAQCDELRQQLHSADVETHDKQMKLRVLSQHVQRLETQNERGDHDLYRLRRDAALLEVQLAEKEVDVKSLEMTKADAALPAYDAATTIQKDKALQEIAAGKRRKEAELVEKRAFAEQLTLQAASQQHQHQQEVESLSSATAIEAATIVVSQQQQQQEEEQRSASKDSAEKAADAAAAAVDAAPAKE